MNILPFPQPTSEPEKETLYLDASDERMVMVKGELVPYQEWLEGELDEAYTQGFWYAWRAWAFGVFMVVSATWFWWSIFI